ncbi:hypothetical protein AVEN_168600-1 [Araneus ventricosus]|uniref:Uncharacterized protein n=1 Tax=Araneus ventricosus TaxID=182803 RepID=A0A4Y2GSI5_ARAVE|nr:hypothetical protein AVEN_168600-1 [Araneus ventricosus]
MVTSQFFKRLSGARKPHAIALKPTKCKKSFRNKFPLRNKNNSGHLYASRPVRLIETVLLHELYFPQVQSAPSTGLESSLPHLLEENAHLGILYTSLASIIPFGEMDVGSC